MRSRGVDYVVTIDGLRYAVEPGTVTGADVRRLAHPPIGKERDLWLEVAWSPDVKVDDTTQVELKDGVAFRTTPRLILPG